MTPLDGYSGCFLFLRRRWNSTTLTHAHCVSVTSSPELFFPCLPLCSKVGMRPGVARRRFDAAIRKRKVLDNFWQSVHDRGIEVVMYGSAHIEPNGKGEPTVSVQDVAKIVKRHVQVIATREYNTTKLCAGWN